MNVKKKSDLMYFITSDTGILNAKQAFITSPLKFEFIISMKDYLKHLNYKIAMIFGNQKPDKIKVKAIIPRDDSKTSLCYYWRKSCLFCKICDNNLHQEMR